MNKTISIILKAVPLAMGVVVIVLSVLNEIEVHSAITMLGIGLACLSLGSLDNSEKNKQEGGKNNE